MISLTTNILTHRKPRVLLLPLEYRRWCHASHYPYSENFALEEGFAAHEIDFFTLPVPCVHEVPHESSMTWLRHARKLLSGQTFDVVWFELSHSSMPKDFLDWMVELAPIRVGHIGESLVLAKEEYTSNAEGAKNRHSNFDRHLPYATHVVAVDEADVARFAAEGKTPAFWYASGHVPRSFIHENFPPLNPQLPALFYGTLYGDRRLWLEHPLLREILHRPESSSELTTPVPGYFDDANILSEQKLTNGHPFDFEVFDAYVTVLREVRRIAFAMWIEGLQNGCAVVNLPQFGQAYASRVTQGIAAGRPVIAYRIPNRPRTEALFEDGKEILLYDNSPEELAEHIRHIKRDATFAQRIIQKGQKKLLSNHTTQHYIGELLHWLDSDSTSPWTRSAVTKCLNVA